MDVSVDVFVSASVFLLGSMGSSVYLAVCRYSMLGVLVSTFLDTCVCACVYVYMRLGMHVGAISPLFSTPSRVILVTIDHGAPASSRQDAE